ncbi:MAG: glycosyltransferase family 4 protein [Acidimicrobiales bacterium]
MEMRARDRAEWLAGHGWVVETLTSAGRTFPHTVADGKLIVRYLRSTEIAHTPVIFGLPIALMKVPRGSVIHLETALAYSPEITAVVCRLRRMPYVIRVALDSAGHGRFRNALLTGYQRTILKQVYRHAARVIVLTPDDIPLVTDKYQVDPSKVLVIPNATNFVLAESPRAVPHDPFRLLFVGRVDLQKNVPLLLRSLRRFVDSCSLPVHLDIAGDGEDMPVVKKAISELSLGQHVTLRGFVTGNRLELLYDAADALVLTSTRETFGQVILEAMTKGLPVVASNIRCVRTIVADGTSGILAELTEDSFAAALIRLASDHELYAKLSSGALESAKHYSMSATVSSYADAYDEVAASLALIDGAMHRT